ncbi:hypothetical protein AAY473_028611 [Plecturocebus cupreus]
MHSLHIKGRKGKYNLFVFLVETGFHHVVQAGLERLTLGDPPASVSQNAGITGVSHCACSELHFVCTSLRMNFCITTSVLRGTMGIIKHNYYDDKSANDTLYEKEFSFGYAVLGNTEVAVLQVVLLVNQRENCWQEVLTKFLHVGEDLNDLAVIPSFSLISSLIHDSVQDTLYLFICVFGDRVMLCRPGWSAVVRSRLTATSTSRVQAILLSQTPSSWDYRWGFTMLVRLVLNSRPQVIRLPWPPKCLDYGREPPHPALIFVFCSRDGMGFHHDGQAGLELLTSGDPPTSASHSARITGVSHCPRHIDDFLCLATVLSLLKLLFIKIILQASTLGGRGGRITSGQEFESSLANIVKLCLY